MTAPNRIWTELGTFATCGTLLVRTALVTPGGGGGAGVTTFVYVATGTEGAAFDIPFPVPRTDTHYVAQVGLGAVAAFFMAAAPVSGYALNQIHVVTSAPPTAGDEITVIIGEI